MTFNWSFTQAIAGTMQDLSDFVFSNMANVTLLRRDSYLDLLMPGVKFDREAALRTLPLHDKRYSGGSYKSLTVTMLTISLLNKHQKLARNRAHRLRNSSVTEAGQTRSRQGLQPTFHSDWQRVTVLNNDNPCVLQWGCVERPDKTETFADSCQYLNVNGFTVHYVACRVLSWWCVVKPKL